MNGVNSSGHLPALGHAGTKESDGGGHVTERHNAVFLPSSTCLYCGQSIVWLRTRFGNQRMPFEPNPVPRKADRKHEGWIPGKWTVNGHRTTALAPATHYGQSTRERLKTVMMLHQCAEYRASQATA